MGNEHGKFALDKKKQTRRNSMKEVKPRVNDIKTLEKEYEEATLPISMSLD